MPARFLLLDAAEDRVKFVLKAANGPVILTGQSYDDVADAKRDIDLVRKSALDDKRFERRSTKEMFYFALTAEDGRELGRGAFCALPAELEAQIFSVKAQAPDAVLQ